jgi:hypothetical protein
MYLSLIFSEGSWIESCLAAAMGLYTAILVMSAKRYGGFLSNLVEISAAAGVAFGTGLIQWSLSESECVDYIKVVLPVYACY